MLFTRKFMKSSRRSKIENKSKTNIESFIIRLLMTKKMPKMQTEHQEEIKNLQLLVAEVWHLTLESSMLTLSLDF